jgi:hypothetical protein
MSLGSDIFEVAMGYKNNGNDGANAIRSDQLGDKGNIFDRWSTQKVREKGQVVEKGFDGVRSIFGI